MMNISKDAKRFELRIKS